MHVTKIKFIVYFVLINSNIDLTSNLSHPYK